MKKSLLLCPPTYYDIKYEINPWMSKDNPIDKACAMEQYETLTYAYEQLGVNYDELAPDESVPDQVFTTDTGHAENKKFIKANFKYGERKKEADIAEAYFKEKGYDIHTLPSDIYFEGGDLIKFDDIYLFGHGKREHVSLEIVKHRDLLDYIEDNFDRFTIRTRSTLENFIRSYY